MIDTPALRALLNSGGTAHLVSSAELRELIDAWECLRELVECKSADENCSAELRRIPYTAEDIKYDRARTVPDELRTRIHCVVLRTGSAWNAARRIFEPTTKGHE